jgi:hypothetical protein
MLEKRVAALLSGEYEYEPKHAIRQYTVAHKYNPDFVHPDSAEVLLEVKGYFRTSSEASKYVHIKRDNPDTEIIFIFSNANKKCHPNCRPRKDGTVLSLHEWCTKNGFLYYTEKNLPKEIKEGRITQKWIKAEKIRRQIKC